MKARPARSRIEQVLTNRVSLVQEGDTAVLVSAARRHCPGTA
jgi:hypothetical protein